MARRMAGVGRVTVSLRKSMTFMLILRPADPRLSRAGELGTAGAAAQRSRRPLFLREQAEIGLGLGERAGVGRPCLQPRQVARGVGPGRAERLDHLGIEQRWRRGAV